MLGNDDEPRFNVWHSCFDRGAALQDERRSNVPGAEIHDADVSLTKTNSKLPEIGIVGQNDPPLIVGTRQHVNVRFARQTELCDGHHVLALHSEGAHHARVNVLVREERKVERPHAGIFTSQTTSFFIACAA